jgi:hypothetical protein
VSEGESLSQGRCFSLQITIQEGRCGGSCYFIHNLKPNATVLSGILNKRRQSQLLWTRKSGPPNNRL